MLQDQYSEWKNMLLSWSCFFRSHFIVLNGIFLIFVLFCFLAYRKLLFYYSNSTVKMWRLEMRKATCNFSLESKELCAAKHTLKLSCLLPSLAFLLETWNSFWVSHLWALNVSHLGWSYQKMHAWSIAGEKLSHMSASPSLLLETQGLPHQGMMAC